MSDTRESVIMLSVLIGGIALVVSVYEFARWQPFIFTIIVAVLVGGGIYLWANARSNENARLAAMTPAELDADRELQLRRREAQAAANKAQAEANAEAAEIRKYPKCPTCGSGAWMPVGNPYVPRRQLGNSTNQRYACQQCGTKATMTLWDKNHYKIV